MRLMPSRAAHPGWRERVGFSGDGCPAKRAADPRWYRQVATRHGRGAAERPAHDRRGPSPWARRRRRDGAARAWSCAARERARAWRIVAPGRARRRGREAGADSPRILVRVGPSASARRRRGAASSSDAGRSTRIGRGAVSASGRGARSGRPRPPPRAGRFSSRRPRRSSRGSPGGRASRPGPSQAIGWPVSFSIAATSFSSWRVTMVKDAPSRPARPVRPMRWT